MINYNVIQTQGLIINIIDFFLSFKICKEDSNRTENRPGNIDRRSKENAFVLIPTSWPYIWP